MKIRFLIFFLFISCLPKDQEVCSEFGDKKCAISSADIADEPTSQNEVPETKTTETETENQTAQETEAWVEQEIADYCPLNLPEIPAVTSDGRVIIRVCPPAEMREGCDSDSIGQAIKIAPNNSRIEIVKGQMPYNQCAVISSAQQNIEILGVCGKAHIKNKVCEKKGIFVNYGKGVRFINLELSHAEIPLNDGGNGAGIRDQSLGGTYFEDLNIHHNQMGMLGGSGILTIKRSKFEANGNPERIGYNHNIYLSADVVKADIQNSLFLRASAEGNNFKSRAQEVIFECSVSASLDGQDSREMDFSEGGKLLIKNSIIQQGSASKNSNMLGFATESNNQSRRHSMMQVDIENSLFINDKSNGSFITYNAYNDRDLSINIIDSLFVGSGSYNHNSNQGPTQFFEKRVETYPDRSSAQLPVVSNNHMDLPIPKDCPGFAYF